ncbi:MAG: MOSC domain-containing protein [Planctomycetota bacterium]
MSRSTESRHLGRIQGLWRYPVKSMGAEALEQVDVTWFGLAGDRRWAFVRDEATSSDFPWLTIRERPDMALYRPSFEETGKPDQSATSVRTPSGTVMDVTDERLSAELYPRGARLIRQNRGVFDTFPLSLISTQTIARLGKVVGAELDVMRFRPNFLVEVSDETPFAEDGWVGSVLQIGELRMRVDKRDGRCVVITVDPLTTERNPDVLRAVAQERQGCLGVYGSVVKPGKVALNDQVNT